MPVELVTIPCLEDNYAYLIGNLDTGEAALIDVPDAGPINQVVAATGWTLTTVLLTHHHWDHIDGLDRLNRRSELRIIGGKADAHRLPPLDAAVQDGDVIKVCDQEVRVLDVSGHTVGHIAFYLPGVDLAFTADSLMAMGCGRLFEGTPAQMWESMKKLRALPPQTVICSGHEYTLTNARFAASLEPDNEAITSRLAQVQAARDDGLRTVPSRLEDELLTNPYLRADDPILMSAIDMANDDPAAVFAEIRARKDKF